MAILVTIVPGAIGGSSVANQTLNFVVTLSNTGSSSVTLTSLAINESSNTGLVRVGQPNYLVPNVPVGLGNPTLTASGSLSYGFQCVVMSPVMPGPSPQAPGGAYAVNAAYYPNADYSLQAVAVTSDGSVSSGSYVAPVLTATFPQSNGGALVLSQGFNLVNLLTL